MKILVTDTTPLNPPLWGGPLRIYNTYANFSNSKVAYVGLNINPGFENTRADLTDNLRESIVKPDKKFLGFRKLQLLLLKGWTFDFYSYLFMKHDMSYTGAITQESAGSDVLISSHPWGFPSIAKSGKGKLLVYDAHNFEYGLMRQLAGKNILGRLACAKARQIEKQACRKSHLIAACSEEDKKSLAKEYGVSLDKIVVIPNAVDVTTIGEAGRRDKKEAKAALGLEPDKKAILFIGAHYTPNIHALRFILEDLAKQFPSHTFLIVGSIKNAIFEVAGTKDTPGNVVFFGQVPFNKMLDVISASDIAINPIEQGSGIHLKMLDYMAAGLPTITTPIGARGIGISSGKEAVICDKKEFANAIRELLSDSAKHSAISDFAREHAKSFDCREWGKKFENEIMAKHQQMGRLR